VRRSSLVRFSVPLCLLAFAVTMVVSPTRELYGTIQILWEISAALLVVAAGANGFLQRVLSLRLLAFIGAASYSIYLVHEPLMELAEARGASPGVAAALGVLVGVAFWALAERPFVRSRVRDALLKKIEPVTYGVLHALGARASLDLSSRPPALRLERTVLAEAEKSVPA
jgi:peptidoglycan/LPS O-acetylase OafA/YrhL